MEPNGSLNGNANGAGVLNTPTPDPSQDHLLQNVTLTHRNKRQPRTKEATVAGPGELERARFMPVMDIEQALGRRQMIVDATKKLMRPDVDYGKVPGTERETLLQPGADKLCNLFGLVIQYETIKCVEDWTGEDHGGEPFFHYEIKGRAYRGEFLMGEGVGSCNSWESKYRYRNAERICPSCSKPNIRKSRDGGWYCWVKTDGCGAQFPAGAPVIETQVAGKKINPDIPDVVNTVLKIAHKRCKVSTTINATSASEFFTQDVEDLVHEETLPVDPDPHGYTIDTGGRQYGSPEAQAYVRDQKLRAGGVAIPEDLPTKSGDMKAAFQQVRERIGETRFYEELRLAGVNHPAQFRQISVARDCYKRMMRIIQLQERAA